MACSKSAFDRAHDQAVAQNPAGVEFQIRTLDGSGKIHVGEPLLLEQLYTSKYPGWHIEILDGWNEASSFDVAFVTDGKSTWTAYSPRGVICCDSRHVWLNLDPVQVPYRYAQTWDGFKPLRYPTAVLPYRPGKYRVYLTTHRVFSKDYSTKTYTGKGIAVTSANILSLEVLK